MSTGVPSPDIEQPSFYGVILENQKEIDTWNRLAKRPVKGTKYYSFGILKCLGVAMHVNHLLGSNGLRNLSEQRRSSYRPLILEFLSTLELSDNKLPSFIKFRLQNKGFRLIKEEVNRMLTGKKLRGNSDGYDAAKWWNLKTEIDEFKSVSPLPVKMELSAISNSMLRILQTVLRNCVFPSPYTRDVTHTELRCLWAIVNSHQIDLAVHLFGFLRRQSLLSNVDLLCGNLITAFADHFQVSCSNWDEAYEEVVSSTTVLECQGILREDEFRHMFWLFGNDLMPVGSDTIDLLVPYCEENLRMSSVQHWAENQFVHFPSFEEEDDDSPNTSASPDRPSKRARSSSTEADEMTDNAIEVIDLTDEDEHLGPSIDDWWKNNNNDKVKGDDEVAAAQAESEVQRLKNIIKQMADAAEEMLKTLK